MTNKQGKAHSKAAARLILASHTGSSSEGNAHCLYAGVKEINDDSVVLVYTAIAMLKNHITDELGRL